MAEDKEQSEQAPDEVLELGYEISEGLSGVPAEGEKTQADASIEYHAPEEEPASQQEAEEEGQVSEEQAEQAEEDAEEEAAEEQAEEEAPQEEHPYANRLAAAQQQHDPSVVARAVQLGFPPQTLGLFSKDNLVELVRFEEAKRQAQPGTMPVHPGMPGAQPGMPGAYPPPGAQPTPGAQPGAPGYDIWQGINKEEFDPEGAQVIDRMNNYMNHMIGQVVGGLNHRIVELESQTAQQVKSAKQQRFDRWIASKGEEYADVFGQGSTSQMREDTPEFVARQSIFQIGEQFERALPGGMDLEVAWDRALLADMPDRQKRVARKQVQKEVQNSKQTMTSKPTQTRSGPEERMPQDPEKRAEEALKRKLKQFGQKDSW